MIVVAWNNELAFQRLVEHHPFHGKDQHVEHPPPKRNLMKDNVKDEVPNGIPNILIPSYKVLSKDGVLKSSNKPKGDHATYFWNLIKKTYNMKNCPLKPNYMAIKTQKIIIVQLSFGYFN